MKVTVIRSEPITPPPTAIHLELTLDEAMMIQAVLGCISSGILNEAGDYKVDGVKVWQGLAKALMGTGMPMKTIRGINTLNVQIIIDDYRKYF